MFRRKVLHLWAVQCAKTFTIGSGSKTFQTNQTWLKNPGTHHGGVWENQSEMGD